MDGYRIKNYPKTPRITTTAKITPICSLLNRTDCYKSNDYPNVGISSREWIVTETKVAKAVTRSREQGKAKQSDLNKEMYSKISWSTFSVRLELGMLFIFLICC